MITNRWIRGIDDLQEPFMIRKAVFQDEKGGQVACERDDYDIMSWHTVAYEDGIPVAAGRVFVHGGKYILSRICVLKEYRGRGYGDLVTRLLMLRALNMGADELNLSAINGVIDFYSRYGFKTFGPEFIEGGIKHYNMRVSKNDVKFPRACET